MARDMLVVEAGAGWPGRQPTREFAVTSRDESACTAGDIRIARH
jgi:hypothetical protein